MKLTINYFIILLSCLLLNSCSVVGGIFNAGVNVGIFISVLFIVLILFVVFKLRKK